jgi:mannose-1-phosphate guanylyltransferase/mannose-6-phosphate isomerase
MIKPVILCGGKGSRLWPLSRELYPKQFLAVGGSRTLFQQTVLRVAGLDAQPPMTICNTEHRFLVAEQLQGLNISGEIVLEPVGRNTAPAIAAAAVLCEREDPVLLVMPADHIMEPISGFAAAVAKALPLAEQGMLVTFGVAPDRPETGFGYIKRGAAMGEGFGVASFVEKPDAATALQFQESGEYYWNSGMFMYRASALLAELERFAPEIVAASRGAVEASATDLDFIRLDKKRFSAGPADSIDYAVMEKTERGAVVPMDVRWGDLGSWSALFDAGKKDDAGNVVLGDVLVQDSRGCYLHSENKLLAAVGLEDVIAVVTADAVLVAHRDQAQQVKEVVNRLHEAGRPEAVLHRKVYRPWGSYESMDIADRFQVKRITVKPGQKLSLQKHHHRAEHWVVVRGTAQIVNGDKEMLLSEDQSTYIPIGNVHRLSNPGKIPLELIEVQTGPYLGEDDIVRLEDVYDRLEK